MITPEQEIAIRDVLATMPKLAVGVGSREKACSIAALNLALTGTLTDKVPDCMSHVIGRWIIRVQDKMPATIRDSRAWRDLLVLSAGTGREHEAERMALVMAWVWDALALVQPRANASGYGVAWAKMLRERTVESAKAAAAVAATYADADAYAAADAAAAAATYAAAVAATYAATYADAAAVAATYAAAYAATYAAADAAAAALDAYAWDTIDPVGLLRRLVAVTDARALAVQP